MLHLGQLLLFVDFGSTAKSIHGFSVNSDPGHVFSRQHAKCNQIIEMKIL